jgi:HNH endonuclease
MPPSFRNLNIPARRDTPRPTDFADGLMQRDITCRVTDVVYSTEGAHLVPFSGKTWWDNNLLGPNFTIMSLSNGILLAAHIHRQFNKRNWIPMVKNNRLVVHVLHREEATARFTDLYHNQAIKSLEGVDKSCLLGRIAWSILPFMR